MLCWRISCWTPHYHGGDAINFVPSIVSGFLPVLFCHNFALFHCIYCVGWLAISCLWLTLSQSEGISMLVFPPSLCIIRVTVGGLLSAPVQQPAFVMQPGLGQIAFWKGTGMVSGFLWCYWPVYTRLACTVMSHSLQPVCNGIASHDAIPHPMTYTGKLSPGLTRGFQNS